MEEIRETFKEIFDKKKVKLYMLLSKFSCSDLNELLVTFSNYFSNDFEYIISDENYMTDLNLFMMDFIKDNIKTEEDLYYLRAMINNEINSCKTFLKPYNKKEKKKDVLYSRVTKLKSLLQYDLDFIDNELIDKNTNYIDAKIINFIVFEVKNPDFVFRMTQTHPELLNTLDANGDKLFTVLVNYYLDNINNLSNEDLTYYKRVFMILFESDVLSLKYDELNKCYDRILNNYNRTNNKEIKYLLEIFKAHYPNLNGTKLNCLSYIKKDAPLYKISKVKYEGYDLTDDFTITIDGLRNSNLTNVLFDDAFILKGSGNDLHLLVCVPHVDMFIKRDSDLDIFMRSLGESIYIKDYKKPLIKYELAKMMSLEKGKTRNCITFDISMDSDANIKGIEFYKSIIKVNYNLTKDKADDFMKYHDFDDRLNVLNKMHDLALKLCRKRKEMIGKRSPAKLIMDEFNILPDLVSANYFYTNNIVFPYKNYYGKLKSGSRKHLNEIYDFIEENQLDEKSKDMLYSILDINNRVFYDTTNYGNKTYKGKPCGSVGNPMREYISLESDRLINDLLINNLNNYDYWLDRASRDCIEYTETSAKIRALYDSKRGR
jgi:hypothetical protein